MSTLGGSRGERHAKPKFTALDINRLYKSSRGESLEPSTQKNQVPRKHGMQSLGKVPSARRPPANLPSLKAETQTPGNTTPGQEQQGGNQTAIGGTNTGQTAQATLNLNTNSNSTSNSQIALSPTTQSSSSYTSSNIGSSAVTWSSVTTGHDGGSSSLPPLYQSPQFHHEFPSLDGSTPGSSSHKSHQKDTHQQHYGGRDGSGGSGNIAQQKDQGDLQQVSLRPQTDAASWIQQQQQSGGGKGGDVHGTQQGQALLQSVPPQFRALMPSFMYRGSGSITGSEQMTGGARSSTPPTQQHQHQQQYSGGGTGQNQNQTQQNGSYSMTQGRQRQAQSSGQVSGQKEYRTNSPNTTGYQHHNSNAPITIQKRPQPQQPASRGRTEQESNSIPYIEPEVALLQRPIIKEEDLERMDSIAKDDGWIRQDEIDYNQKLIFSDDESPDSPGTERGPPVYGRNEKMVDKKSSRNQDEDNRSAWNRERERERERDNKERVEREHLERERNERNERERERDHSRATTSESSSKSDRERERENCTDNTGQQSVLQRPQQNGHRGLDAGVFERVKQRKEEEEKREFERKQAAAKKLQELEMKMNTKKNEEDCDDMKHVSNEDEYSSKSKLYRDSKDIRDSRDNRESREAKDFRDIRDSRDSRDVRDIRESRDYGRYEKYERDINQRERDSSYKDNYIGGPAGARGNSGGNKGLFSAHFQNNLPPRFARQQQQQQERTSSSGSGQGHQIGSGPISSRDLGSSSSSRSITANHQPSSHYHHSGSDSSQKLVPFAQQYDPRYIHSQNYKQQQLRRNPSDEMIQPRRNERAGDNFNVNPNSSRRRGDSEDDDRFSNSGRESASRNSLGESSRPGNVTPQLARSVSDSSQRKTSVSSTDEQKQNESISAQNLEPPRIFGSWAEETESEMKRRRESFSSEHSIPKHDSSAEEAVSQPKQILQRPQSKSLSESSSKKEEVKVDLECKKDDVNASNSNVPLAPRQQSPVVPTQILKRPESPTPKAWSECVAEEQEKEAHEKPVEATSFSGEESSTSVQNSCNNAELSSQEISKGECDKVVSEEQKKESGSLSISGKKESEDKQESETNKSHHSQKRPSPRGGRQDMRGPPSRGYGIYRGGSGSWSRRGGGGGMRLGGRNYNDHWTDSENSEEMDEDYGNRRSERSPKIPRKERENKGDSGGRGNHPLTSKEGFAPRGEPSRRGRGGGSSGVSSFRRGGLSGQGPKRMDSYGGSSNSKSNFNGSSTTANLNEEKSDKTGDRKPETSTDDKTKLNQMALSAGLNTRKSSECGDDSSKSRDKGSQPKPQREEKKSPPKQFGGPQYQSQGLRKDSTCSSKNDAQSQSSAHMPRKDDEINKKESPPEMERKKSLSKEKDLVHEAPKQQRSNSSGHISSSRSTSHIKKEERSSLKTMTKPPLGLGFKQNSNGGPGGQQQPNQQHKEQPLVKSKSSGDTRGDSRGNSKTNLPPRLAKQWESRSKRDGNQSDSSGSSHQQQSSNNNAWEKPLQQPHETNKQIQESDKDFNQQHGSHQQQGNQNNCGSDSKSNVGQKGDSNSSKTVLDPSSAPVNTIIFENTNYKTVQAPLKRQISNQSDSTQSNQKKQDEVYKSQSTSSMQDMQQTQISQQQQTPQPQREQQQIQQQPVVHSTQPHQQQGHTQQQQQQEAITTALSQMSFAKSENDYEKDMKLGFPFDTEFSHLTEDKTTSANKPGLCLPRSSSVIHSSAASQNTISPSTADLNMKIASVKKVWESVPPMPTVLEHAGVAPSDAESHLSSNFVTSQHQQHLQHFAAAAHAAHGGNIHMQHALSSPGPPSYANTFDPSLDPHFGNKDGVVVGNNPGNPPDAESGGYSPSPQHAVGSQAQHQSTAQSNLALKHAAEALSSNNGNVCKVKPTQQQMHQSSLGLSPPPAMQQGTTQLHQAPQPFYQPSQFGAMPTIPSPPTTVLFNNSPMPSQGGLYGPFQIEAGRSQFSQFPGHYGTAGSGPYSAYMQTPPNMPTAPAPDMYPSLTSQFRIGGAVQTPFNQSQQLNNPSTVLISSSSNSLMSASVKPSSQQIGAIGSKSNAAAVAAAAASVGQPYGQQYMNLYPPQQAPPPLQSNSYYSNSAGGQGAFFGGPTAAGATQSYGLQAAAAGIFGGHGGPAPSTGPPQQQIANFSSQFINSPLLTAAAINQFRGGPTPQTATAYMKSNQGQNHMQDSMGRQLKSPLGTDVSLNLAKQVQPQQSPPHHKNYAPSWDIQNQVMQQQSQSQNPQNRSGNGPNSINSGRPGQGPQRYPTPIQRPTNYPTHQPPTQQPPSQRPVRQPHSGPGGPINKHYYGNSGGGSGRGGHSSNPVDQSKQATEKNIDSASSQQDISVKEDNSND